MRLLQFLCCVWIAGSSACKAQPSGMALGAKAFHDSLIVKQSATILDVRTHEEFESGHLEAAFNMNFNDALFKEKIGSLDKNKPYFVYCLSGGRSSSAASYMRSNGFKEVYDLKGGIMAWQGRDYPVVKPAGVEKADEISEQAYQHLCNADSLVLVDFYATWCAPCKKMEPILDELKKENAGKFTITRIDIDKNKKLAVKLAVEEVPVYKLFYKGKEVWMKKGIVEKKDILEAIAAAK